MGIWMKSTAHCGDHRWVLVGSLLLTLHVKYLAMRTGSLSGGLPTHCRRDLWRCWSNAPLTGCVGLTGDATPPHETQTRNAFRGRMPSGWHCPIPALGTERCFSRSTPLRVGTRVLYVQTPGRLVRTGDRSSRRYAISVQYRQPARCS